MTVPAILRSRHALISIAFAAVLALMFTFGFSTRFLRGSLLDDQVLTLADGNLDGVLSIGEMRRAVTDMIGATETNDLAYDLSGNGTTDRTDLTLLLQSIRAHLSAVCGNGIVEPGEQCDDGNQSNTDACLNTCKLPVCGNQVLEGTEQCDNGPQNSNTSSCTLGCRLAACVDGFKQGAEECDDGDQLNTNSCTNICKNAACVDGFKQGTEECDDGNQVNTDSCTSLCKLAKCVDGFKQGTEECDDGDQDNTNFCTNSCKNARCGDGFKQGAEACDDGNTVDTDDCRNTCILPRCGDSIVQGTEQCDDGNTVQTDLCMNTCILPISDTSIEQFCANNSVYGDLTGIFESAFTYPSTITHAGEAYAGVGVITTRTTGTIYRSVRQGNTKRWLKEAQFPSINSPNYANIRFFSTANNLVATLEASNTGSMILKREQNGKWANISFPVPTALGIGSLIEHDGKIYFNSRNNGIVYRHDGGRIWTPIATVITGLKGIASLNNTLYAISISNLYRFDGVSWVNVPIQGVPFANSTSFVSFRDSLFVNGFDGTLNKSMVYKFNPTSLFTPAERMQVGNPPTGMSQLSLQVAGSHLIAGAYASTTTFGLFRYVSDSNTWVSAGINYSNGQSINSALVTLQSASPPGSWYVNCAKTSICGDSVREGSEQCDDGNAIETDSCLSTCTFRCGDGVRQGAEQCDDGNTVETDECSNLCRLPACGNGVVEGSEQCDDQNTTLGDGCNATCVVETNYTCSGSPSRCERVAASCVNSQVVCNNGVSPLCNSASPNATCVGYRFNASDPWQYAPYCCTTDSGDCRGGTPSCNGVIPAPPPTPVCGDSIVQIASPYNEQCDDGNRTSNDGCSAACRNEICGDGVKQPSESCDDGNTINTDSCTNACALPVCGDGFTQTGEQCDDGNALVSDGCTPICTTSPVVPSLCGVGSFKAVTLPSPTATQRYQSISFFYPTTNLLFLADDAQVSYFNNVSWRSAGVKENIIDPSGYSTNIREITTQTALYLDEETQTLYLGTYSGDTWKQQVQGSNMEGVWHFLGRLPASIASLSKKNGKIHAFSGRGVYELSTSWDFTRGYWTGKAAFPVASPGAKAFFADHDTLLFGGAIYAWNGTTWDYYNTYPSVAEPFGATLKHGVVFINILGITTATPANVGGNPITFVPYGGLNKGMYRAHNVTGEGVFSSPLWQKIQGIEPCSGGTSTLACISSDDFTDWKGEYWKFNADAGLGCMKMP